MDQPIPALSTPRSKPTILIVGDWVVDEYWFLVRHHSQLSSQTGAMQYRIFSKPGDRVKDLCGAGHIARILYSLRHRDQPRYDYELVGLGNWNKEDELLLKHLVHAEETGDCPARNAAFTALPQMCKRVPQDIDLLALRSGDSTIRVIRQYHQEHGHWEQINRADWEQRADEGAKSYSMQSLHLPTADRGEIRPRRQLAMRSVVPRLKGSNSSVKARDGRMSRPEGHLYRGEPHTRWAVRLFCRHQLVEHSRSASPSSSARRQTKPRRLKDALCLHGE